MPPAPKPAKKTKKKIGHMRPSEKKAAARIVEKSILEKAISDAEKRDRERGVSGRCLACLVGILLPGDGMGSGRATEWNHCVPRSRLPGKENYSILHSPANLAHTCREHHEAFDARPEFWLPIMQYIYGYCYPERPFAYYLERPHPKVEFLTRNVVPKT